MTGSTFHDRPECQEACERLLSFAALSGHFDPVKVLDIVEDILPERADPRCGSALAVVASALASQCLTKSGKDGQWIMLWDRRATMLQGWQSDGRLTDMIAWRRGFPCDQEAQDLHAVIRNEAPMTTAEIEAALADGADTSLDRLARIWGALAASSGTSPSHHLTVRAEQAWRAAEIGAWPAHRRPSTPDRDDSDESASPAP